MDCRLIKKINDERKGLYSIKKKPDVLEFSVVRAEKGSPFSSILINFFLCATQR
jgi:hypothetical protein